MELHINNDTRIEKIKLPDTLTSFSFGREFNQPIENVKWPISLTTLKLGEDFNYPVDFLPETLKTLINK